MKKKKFIHIDEIHIPIILLDILKNGWLAILAVIAVCIGVFAYSNSQHQPVYTTEATFVVSPRSNGSYVGFYSSLSTANEMASVFQEVFSDPDSVLHGFLGHFREVQKAIMLRGMEQTGNPQHCAYILACPVGNLCQVGSEADLGIPEQSLQNSGSFV